MLRIIILIQLLLVAYLQTKLWFGEASPVKLADLDQAIAQQQQNNLKIQQENTSLIGQVKAFQSGLHLVESRARLDLGMIKDGESFFLLPND